MELSVAVRAGSGSNPVRRVMVACMTSSPRTALNTWKARIRMGQEEAARPASLVAQCRHHGGRLCGRTGRHSSLPTSFTTEAWTTPGLVTYYLHCIRDRTALPPCTDPGLDAVSGRSLRHQRAAKGATSPSATALRQSRHAVTPGNGTFLLAGPNRPSPEDPVITGKSDRPS